MAQDYVNLRRIKRSYANPQLGRQSGVCLLSLRAVDDASCNADASTNMWVHRHPAGLACSCVRTRRPPANVPAWQLGPQATGCRFERPTNAASLQRKSAGLRLSSLFAAVGALAVIPRMQGSSPGPLHNADNPHYVN